MAFTNHLRDDVEQYAQSMRESTGPFRYLFEAPVKNIARDNVTNDPRGVRQGIQVNTCVNMPLVDVDSDMLGITRRAGYANQFAVPDMPKRYVMRREPEEEGEGGVGVGASAKAPRSGGRVDESNGLTLLDGEDCRFSNPPSTLRGTGINRFEWLCRDPQELAISPHPRTPINYRLVAKDNHRPLIEQPMADRVSPYAPSRSSGAYSSVKVGKSIERALQSYPAPIQNQHWRDIGEIRRIIGRPADGPAPSAWEG